MTTAGPAEAGHYVPETGTCDVSSYVMSGFSPARIASDAVSGFSWSLPSRTALLGMLALLSIASVARAQPASPFSLTAADHPWDNGTRIDLRWTLSSDDGSLREYVVRKKGPQDAAFTRVDAVPPGTSTFTVTDLTPEQPYSFSVIAVARDGAESPAATTPGTIAPTLQWFDGTRVWFLVTLVLFCGAVLGYIVLARRGMQMKVRQIAGLAAVDEAVGRATEMGRSILFVPGIQDMNEIMTIAGLNVLARVAKTAAEYDARLEVPTSYALVMTAARETVQTAFLEAGRPDAYNPDLINYISSDQWGYVGYLQGTMMREKPAACFYMGSFFAESLILAEAGNRIGAIQIAGTARSEQLPFFVAACDYTLIGEEFFAASAYLSGEPDQLGSLKGQDVGKAIVAAGIVAGVLGTTLASLTGSPLLQSVVTFFTQTMLN
jgi:uncharacterized protein DUF6754/fibronectin type III domain protein